MSSGPIAVSPYIARNRRLTVSPGFRFTVYAILSIVIMFLDQRGEYLDSAILHFDSCRRRPFTMKTVFVVGAGPAGLAAGLTTAHRALTTLVIEAKAKAGGQPEFLYAEKRIVVIPGFPDGILGPELMERMKKQAERFGAEFVTDDVTRVDFVPSPAFNGTWYSDGNSSAFRTE